MRELRNFELNIERSCSHEELNFSIAKSLNIRNSQVAIYSDDDLVDSYDDVVVKVCYFDQGFRTLVKIHNDVRQENPLSIAKLISAALQTRILIEALDIVPIWIMCTSDGELSYVNAIDDEDDSSLTLSVRNPARPFYKINDSDIHATWESIELQSRRLINWAKPYLQNKFTEVCAEHRVAEQPDHQGKLSQLFIWGINKSGDGEFLDIKDISVLACTLEVVSVFAGGLADISKNYNFKITMHGLTLEQNSPGQTYKYTDEN